MAGKSTTGPATEAVVPLCTEEVSLTKRKVVTGYARVSTTTRQYEQVVGEHLLREEAEIERKPVGKLLDDAPEVRQIGDTLVIPVVEEVLVTQRRFMLKEEIRIRRVRALHVHRERVRIRKQEVSISHQPATTREHCEPTRLAVSCNTQKGEVMAYEKIVAAYDKAGKAREAARALEASGFPAGDISLLSRDTLSTSDMRDAGIWRRLFGRNVGDGEGAVYNRTIETGGTLLTLRALDTDIPRAMKILDIHTPVDVNEQAATYARSAAVPPMGTGKAPATEEVLRLAEEQIDVGKRVVEIGKARIRRFVVEKPVESQITLHEEHAALLRRAATDAANVKDVDWSDKTFEITETAEQAVVSKTARVAEEVVVRVEGSDRVETVHDTVRRQQVELEHVPRDLKRAA